MAFIDELTMHFLPNTAPSIFTLFGDI